jgi:hypothetical protein
MREERRGEERRGEERRGNGVMPHGPSYRAAPRLYLVVMADLNLVGHRRHH